MMYETWIAIGAVIVLVVSIVVIISWFSRDLHEVYDPGDGSVKIRCPDDESPSILFGWGSKIVCPICGEKMDPPTKRNQWQKR